MKTVWLAALAVVGILVYATGFSSEDWSRAPAAQNYNLLVQGFRRGQLSLAKEAPAGLMELADPYDPAQNEAYRFGADHLHDLSLYGGKLYLYFGATPVLLLLPWSILIRHYLSDATIVLIFCALGVLATTGVLVTLRRLYFPEVKSWALAVLIGVVGLTSGLPMLLQRPGMHEIPIACAYACVALSLWCLLHAGAEPTVSLSPCGTDGPPREPGGKVTPLPVPPALTPYTRDSATWWLFGAGLCYGLAIAARPSLLPGAILFLVINPSWSRTGVRNLAAWAVPLGACLIGLLVYNQARFHSPFEFGQKYQLADDRQDTAHHFRISYLPCNLRVYFANPANSTLPPAPSGHALPEDPFGVLPNLPFVLLALAAPLALPLRRFTKALAFLFAASLAPLALFYGTCSRYEIDFLPPLVLLAAIGVLTLEAGAGRYRTAARVIWLALATTSLVLMATLARRRHAQELYNLGTVAGVSGHSAEAIPYFESALRVRPGYADAEQNLATSYAHLHRLPEAITHFQAAMRLNPASAVSHFNLGIMLFEAHRPTEAANEFRAALRIDPTFESARANLNAIESRK